MTKPSQSKIFEEKNRDPNLPLVEIYTDGSALGNPGPGGYACILKWKDRTKTLSQGYRHTTNNRMEIMACIAGLECLKKKCQVVVYTDSQYVRDSMEKGWARKWKSRRWLKSNGDMAENVDLWEKMLCLCDKHEVTFKWIRGHAGNKYNEACDLLAKEAASSPNRLPDTEYEKKSGKFTN